MKHTICDRCFKLAGPIEELTIGRIGEVSRCSYCGETLRGWAHRQGHTLRGEGPDPMIRMTLERIWLLARGLPEAEDEMLKYIDRMLLEDN